MEQRDIQVKIKASTLITIKKMAPAVLTALVATALGFIALYTSPVPMIQDFGKMLTVGMVISFLVAILLLIPILFTRDYFFTNTKQVSQKQKTKKEKVSPLLNIVTHQVIKFKWIIIILAFISASLGIWLDLQAEVETDIEKFMPQETQELKDIHKVRQVLGTTDQVSIVYEADLFNTGTLEWVNKITEDLLVEFPETVVQTNSITTVLKKMNDGELSTTSPEINKLIDDIPENQLKLLINEEQTKGVITVGIKHLEAEPLKGFISDLHAYLDRNTHVETSTVVTGKSVLDVEMIYGLTTGRYKMTLLGMLFVFGGLLLIYRHPVKAFIPLLPILFIIGWSGAAMHFLGINYTPLTATLGALIIGIGTEFTVLIMERFYEERENGHSKTKAIVIANQKIGKAIFTSALTTIGGFSALLISDFVILSNFGMMTLINIVLALLSTIIVMPAILIILDRFIKVKPEVQINEG